MSSRVKITVAEAEALHQSLLREGIPSPGELSTMVELWPAYPMEAVYNVFKEMVWGRRSSREYNKTLRRILYGPLAEVPLYINEESDRLKTIARWRLSIGK